MPDTPRFSTKEIDRIIQMAWEDRTPFEAITYQFGIRENEVREIMRREMKPSSFKMWRKRVTGRRTKQQRYRGEDVQRFRSANQKD